MVCVNLVVGSVCSYFTVHTLSYLGYKLVMYKMGHFRLFVVLCWYCRNSTEISRMPLLPTLTGLSLHGVMLVSVVAST